jgi:hypothetical protein
LRHSEGDEELGERQDTLLVCHDVGNSVDYLKAKLLVGSIGIFEDNLLSACQLLYFELERLSNAYLAVAH